MTEIDITVNERGFHGYGNPVETTYGHVVRVYESSAASGPHCWLDIAKHFDLGNGDIPRERATAHLNEEQARAIAARLLAWADEIPSRWELSTERN